MEGLKPGQSTVEFLLEPDGRGTMVRLRHYQLPKPAVAPHRRGRGYSGLVKLRDAAEGRTPIGRCLSDIAHNRVRGGVWALTSCKANGSDLILPAGRLKAASGARRVQGAPLPALRNDSDRSKSATSCSRGHAGRDERPTLSTSEFLILRLLLAIGPFFFFLGPLGLRLIPLPHCPFGDFVDLGRR